MTDKELHKLKRSELLELLIYMREELDKLQNENMQLREKIGGAEDDHALLLRILEAVAPSGEAKKETSESVPEPSEEKQEKQTEDRANE